MKIIRRKSHYEYEIEFEDMYEENEYYFNTTISVEEDFKCTILNVYIPGEGIISSGIDNENYSEEEKDKLFLYNDMLECEQEKIMQFVVDMLN